MRTRLVVYGEVQGVGYRAFVKHIAERLGLHGYAKNMPDGSVEILVEAKEPALIEEFKNEIAAFSRNGAEVEKIEEAPVNSNEEFASFEIF